ncbi:MAG TPA: TonB-dependent receptor [Gemmatimonadaceae bacterium]|nr:TonB-dependent receptor [Gemmatimonadaceae bacterium]
MRSPRLAAAAALAACALPAAAQRGDSAAPPARDSVTRLAPVVTVARGGRRSTLDLPYAISRTRPDSARPGQRHVQLSETALALNGAVIADRTNPAQDPRVSIRGVGARSQFGVRGIRILRDGMPLTLPDGQTPIDYLDLEAIGTVEAMRGAASSLYGNASGGVIDFRTAPPPDAPLAAQVRASWAGYGSERYAGVLGGSFRDGGWDANYGYMQTDGYRAHAAMQATNGYGRMLYGAGAWSLELQTMGLDMPVALNPGALTQAELDSNPRMADPRSVLKDARKVVSQIQTGLSARRPLGDGGDFSAQFYGGTRDLYNPLTFAIVGVDRYAYGAGARATIPGHIGAGANRLTAGVDAQYQHDDRSNWANCNGLAAPTAACPSLAVEQGALTLQQTEIVSSLGPYLRDELDVADGWILSLGVRGDWTRFEVQDRFLADGDASGSTTMSAVSPMAGVVWRAAEAASLYANIAGGFETPTVTELTNQPDGSAGINEGLQPQRSWNYEIGAKGVLAGRTTYDVALYDTEVQQELIPFQAPSGRTYYRNAGRTRRSGFELGLATAAGPVELAFTYGLSRFVFVDFAVDTNVYDGNTVPGVPEHVAQFAGTYRWRALWGTLELVAKSRVYANDANSASAPGYLVVNVRAGGSALWGKGRLQPVIGVSNLFGARYVGSVAVNAALGQYYEPAPGRVLTLGLSAGLDY